MAESAPEPVDGEIDNTEVDLYCEKKFFDERTEVNARIAIMIKAEGPTKQNHYAWTHGIMNRYLEQAHLLDPYLHELADPIVAEIKRIVATLVEERRVEAEAASAAFDAQGGAVPTPFPCQVYKNPKLYLMFKLLYLLFKVRGYKTMVKVLPHEVSDFEPLLLLLQSQDRADHSTWEMRYVLLLWLSMLCLVPFDLATIDSSSGDATTSSSSIVSSLLTMCKGYLEDHGATQVAASVCLSRLLSRPDMEAHHLNRFLTWANSELEAAQQETKDERTRQFKVTGIMLSLAHIAKNSPREQHIHASRIYFKSVMQLIAKLADEDARSDRPSSSTLHRKLSVKLVQRLGLLYLPPRIRSWRYKRGLRSLELNMKSSLGSNSVTSSRITVGTSQGVEEEIDAPFEVVDELEQIVEVLLCGLRDKDTVVRWSAAKGIGRITGRLPYEFADDIVQSVLELFVATEGDGAWHGASLALAELARRGVLLPERLSEAISCVGHALQYDIRRGNHSIGSHVRDAACYACWSFARAYEPSLLLPYLANTLAPAMLILCVFDRELNCRRAASAAFQESVGRQGLANFPNGVELLTRADYFSVANLRHAYLEVSVFIARYPEYRYYLLDHLMSTKISHWDANVRTLAAAALGKISAMDPAYAMTRVLPQMIALSVSEKVELVARHGATIAVSELLFALLQVPVFLDGELQKELKTMPIEVEKRRLFRGRGGEMIRAAVCTVIEAIACARISLSFAHVKKYLAILEECFVHPVDTVRSAAIDAFSVFTAQYCPKIIEKGSPAHVQFLRDLIPRFLNSGVLVKSSDRGTSSLVLNPNVAARKGFTRAIGVASKELVRPSIRVCFETLLRAASIHQQTTDEQDAESRVAAIQAIVDLCSRPQRELSLENMEDAVMRTLIECIQFDYGVDERGDVGSWVRKAAMIGLEQLLLGEISSVRQKVSTLVNQPVKTKYGDGVIATVTAAVKASEENLSSRNIVCHVTFLKPSLGFYYFGPTGVGLIHLSDVVLPQGLSWNDERGALEFDQDKTFDLPSFEDRMAFVEQRKDSKKTSDTASTEAELLFSRRISPFLVGDLMRAIAKQLAEKLDGMRVVAGKTLFRLLHATNPRVDGIPDRFQLENQIFPVTLTTVNWSMAHDTFPLVVRVMDIPEYTEAVTAGLVLSVGGLTESVVKASKAALLDWMRSHLEAKDFGLLSRFCFILVTLLTRHQKDDRVTLPLLNTIATLLESGLMKYMFTKHNPSEEASTAASDFGGRLYAAVRDEIQQTTAVPKLAAAIAVLVGLLPSERETEAKSLKALIMFLGHRFPKVRKLTAERLYTKLLVHEEVVDEAKYDSAVEILSETAWDAHIVHAREARNSLLDLFEMERPQKKQRGDESSSKLSPAAVESNQSYETLVKEMGY